MEPYDPEHNGTVDWSTLDRYLAGEATKDEEAHIRTQLKQSIRLESLLRDTRTYVTSHRGLTSVDVLPSWKTMSAKISALDTVTDISIYGDSYAIPQVRIAQEPDNLRARARRKFVGGWRRPFPLLLSGLVIVCICALAVVRRSVLETGIPSSSSGTQGTVTYSTGNAQQGWVTLPDGSTVFLNVSSRIEISGDFQRGNRTVHLAGEALFSVENRKGAPFVVQSGNVHTRVLGTSFVVRNYPDDTAVLVAVREGRVNVGATILDAFQGALIDRSGSVTTRIIDTLQFSFTNGVFITQGKPLPEIIPTLNRWYDVDIRLGDSRLATRGVDGMFSMQSIAELTEYLEYALNLRVEREGRILTLFSR